VSDATDSSVLPSLLLHNIDHSHPLRSLAIDSLDCCLVRKFAKKDLDRLQAFEFNYFHSYIVINLD